jgi:Zn-finger nucleic acid-binding protein
MKCPVCDVPLSISSREGVEIDFCPQCRGVWLDRGELDKVIERASASLAPAPAPAPARSPGGDRERYDDRSEAPRYDDRGDDRRYDDRRDDRRDDRSPDDRRPPKKRKRSFLEDLFEFD